MWKCGNAFSCVIQKYTKFANFTELYIFHILQYFSTKLDNYMNFKMLFAAELIDFQKSKVCLIEEWSIDKTRTFDLRFATYDLFRKLNTVDSQTYRRRNHRRRYRRRGLGGLKPPQLCKSRKKGG